MKSDMQSSASTNGFAIDNRLLCRGDGRFYMKLHVKSPNEFTTLQCIAHADGTSIPTCTYPLDAYQHGADQIWVLEAPLMEARNYTFSFHLDNSTDASTELPLSSKQITWMSRINYRLKHEACMEIRDFEAEHFYKHYQIVFTNRFDGSNCAIWRAYVRWTGASDRMPTLSILDLAGHQIDARCLLLELQLAKTGEDLEENRAYFSLILPDELDEFVVAARDDGPSANSNRVEMGFGCMHKDYSAFLKSSADKTMMPADKDPSYQQWFADHKISNARIAEQRVARLNREPVFDIVITNSHDNAKTKKTAQSIERQTYPHWNIINRAKNGADLSANFQDCIDASSGDLIAFIESGDTIEPDALFEYAKKLQSCSSPVILYCDEDVCDDTGTHINPQFKTPLNLDLLFARNCIGHMLVLDRALLASQHFSDIDYLALDGYAIVLHALNQKADFIHVPHVLYHKNSSGDDASIQPETANDHGKKVLGEFLAAQSIKCHVISGEQAGNFKVEYDLPSPHPLVSIIIPNKDHIDVLDPCVNSILNDATYDNYEILIIENNSTDEVTFEYYEHITSTDSRVRVVQWDHEFNYSKIINFGAAKALGNYLLFLNNDTKVISASFIEEMMGFLQRPDVGVVGAKLFYKDGLVQHAGMMVDPFGAVAHVNQNRPMNDGGYQNLCTTPGNYTSVTGACQMVRADVFNEIEGYDDSFAVGFNDVDFCMRAWEAGYRVVFAPDAQLYHYEFTSRGRELADTEKLIRWKREHALFMARWPKPFIEGDPFVNPNLKPNSFYYGLP